MPLLSGNNLENLYRIARFHQTANSIIANRSPNRDVMRNHVTASASLGANPARLMV
jgi:hypothetical protein